MKMGMIMLMRTERKMRKSQMVREKMTASRTCPFYNPRAESAREGRKRTWTTLLPLILCIKIRRCPLVRAEDPPLRVKLLPSSKWTFTDKDTQVGMLMKEKTYLGLNRMLLSVLVRRRRRKRRERDLSE